MTADWPTEARGAVAEIIREASRRPANSLAVADAVLAALTPHVQPRTDEWEWALRSQRPVGGGGTTNEAAAREALATVLAKWGPESAVLVRRRPAGEWEPAP